jgi:hypothetical protein
LDLLKRWSAEGELFLDLGMTTGFFGLSSSEEDSKDIELEELLASSKLELRELILNIILLFQIK